MTDYNEIIEIVQTGKMKQVEEAVSAVANKDNAKAVLDSMIKGMDIIGDKFQRNEAFVPEMLAAAMTMQKGVAVIKPLLGDEDAAGLGTVVIGTVAGDLHDIGKNLVALMFEGAGFEVNDLGVDVPADKFIEAIKADPNVKIVAISALLTTTMPAMKETVEAIKAAGLDEGRSIMIGGAPITQEFADEIGANAYTPDAGSAAKKAKELVA